MRKLDMRAAVMVSLVLLLSKGLAEADNRSRPPCDKLRGTYAFRLVSVKSFAAESGTSGLADAPYQDILRVGVLKIKGDCSVTGDVRATIDDNNGNTRLVLFNWTGTVTPSTPNLEGELNVSPDPSSLVCRDSTVAGKPTVTCPTAADGSPVEGAEEYEYVVVKGERALELIQSDNVGGGAKIFMTGRAAKQEE